MKKYCEKVEMRSKVVVEAKNLTPTTVEWHDIIAFLQIREWEEDDSAL